MGAVRTLTSRISFQEVMRNIKFLALDLPQWQPGTTMGDRATQAGSIGYTTSRPAEYAGTVAGRFLPMDCLSEMKSAISDRPAVPGTATLNGLLSRAPWSGDQESALPAAGYTPTNERLRTVANHQVAFLLRRPCSPAQDRPVASASRFYLSVKRETTRDGHVFAAQLQEHK